MDSKAGLRRIVDTSDPSWMSVRVENDAGKKLNYKVQQLTSLRVIHDAFIRDTEELLRSEIFFNGVKAEDDATIKSLKIKPNDRLEVRRILDVKKEAANFVGDGKDTKPVLVTIKTPDGLSADYRVLPTGFLRLILNDFKNKYISPTAVVKFRFNGVPIAQDDTPEKLEMDDKEENEIEAFEPQKGGSYI